MPSLRSILRSNSVPCEFSQIIPGAVEEIKRGGSRGDFICIWMRKKTDDPVYKAFKSSFNAQRSNKYKEIPFDPELPPIATIQHAGITYPKSTFLRSDHAAFWYHKVPDIPSLSAILLTDLGEHGRRGL